MRHVRIIGVFLIRLAIPATLLILAACTTLGTNPRAPVPRAFSALAAIASPTPLVAPIRYWGDDVPSRSGSPTIESAIQSQIPLLTQNSEYNFLSLSGGGFNGAFGTGYLAGWTKRGNRPEFQTVTGISVGALIAPFAFLGSEYDEQLINAFTKLTSSAGSSSGVLGLLFGAQSFSSNQPLVEAIEEVITEQTLDAIARKYNRGHRLYVGTTNLDAERPVVWDIGAIAISDIPDKVELVRKVLLASAALPGIYPPVIFDVVVDGKAYNELHVDGGVTQQVVLVPDRNYAPKSENKQIKANLFVIYNGQLNPAYGPVKQGAMDVLVKTVPTFIKYLGRSDIDRLRKVGKRNGAAFKLASIPPDYETKDEFPPTPEYLEQLIALGYEMGLEGDWKN